MSNVNDKFAEVYTEWDPLVWNILRSKVGNGLLPSDMDDVHQEIWQAIWEKALKDGEYPVYEIASITRHKITDFQRKDSRLNKANPWGIDTRVAYYGTNDDSTERSHVTGVYAVPEEEDQFYLNDEEERYQEAEQRYQDFINKYPEGSKERRYIDYYLDAYERQRKGEKVKATDGKLAQELGWSGTSSAPWKRFKAKMQKEIADYLGYTPEEKEFAPRGRTARKDT